MPVRWQNAPCTECVFRSRRASGMYAPAVVTIRRVFLVVPHLGQITGAERHAVTLAHALARRGLDVSVFCASALSGSSEYRRTLPAAGIRLVAPRPPVNRPREGDEVDEALAASVRSSPIAELHRQYRRSAAVAPPDVVHVHGFRLDTAIAAAFASRDGVPVVYTEHGTLD